MSAIGLDIVFPFGKMSTESGQAHRRWRDGRRVEWCGREDLDEESCSTPLINWEFCSIKFTKAIEIAGTSTNQVPGLDTGLRSAVDRVEPRKPLRRIGIV